ncbi:hypothetical protein [Terrihabitans sp. B22-R8]|uniref:hypothetical protein n=1 Tax=Terrihabitans sp. B22-R8 TaxID=3425128 RepID=UPI00403CDDED
MAAPVPDPGSTKEFLDWLIYGVVGVVTLLFAKLSTSKGEKEAKAKGPEFLVTGGGFMDMEPVRDLAAQVMGLSKFCDIAFKEWKACHEQQRRIADELECIRKLMQERAEEEHITAEVERRVKEALRSVDRSG